MINSIKIKNFLSHKVTKLEFAPGVNIIVGPSDSGKSAIIRALKWLITNRPLGDAFRSVWGGETYVRVDLSNNYSVLRGRDDKGSLYSITSPDDSSIEFNAFKGDIPQEVQSTLDLNELNLQTQFESHFLLSKSSGDVAQYFNKVAHLDKIDGASQNIRKWLREINQKLSFLEHDQLEGLFTQLEQYKNLEAIELIIVEIEGVDVKVQDLVDDYDIIEALVDGLVKADEELEGLSFLLELGELVDETIKVSNDLIAVQNTSIELNRIIQSIRMVDDDLRVLDKGIKEQEQKFHKELGSGKVCPLCGTVVN